MAHQPRRVRHDAEEAEGYDKWKDREFMVATGANLVTVGLPDGGEFAVPVLIGIDGRPGVDLAACLYRIEGMLQGGEITELRARLCRGAVVDVAEQFGEVVVELPDGDPRWTCRCAECEGKRRQVAA